MILEGCGVERNRNITLNTTIMDVNSTLLHSNPIHRGSTSIKQGLNWQLLLQIVVANIVLWVFPDLVIKSLGALALPITILCIVMVMNAMAAVGRGRLSGGTALIAFSSFAVLAWIAQAVTILYISLGGALALAILMLFASASRIGKYVSMGLGLALSLVALGLVQGSSGPVSFAVVLMVLAYPVVNIIGVAVKRMLKGRSPFMHDGSHLHDGMLSAGLSSTVVERILLGVSVILALFAVTAALSGIPDTLLYAVATGMLVLFVLWK